MCEVHVFCASASSCPTAYKLSAAIMVEGLHCVKDKGAECQWELTVIYEYLSKQRQVNMRLCTCVFGVCVCLFACVCLWTGERAGGEWGGGYDE